MNEREMQERLNRAMTEIQLVEDQLNNASHPCATCGLTIREDFTQHQMRTQLEATRQKLRRFALALAARFG